MSTQTQKTEKNKTTKKPPLMNGAATKAVATKTDSALPTAVNDAAAWGAPALSSRDIVIPKIYAMQAMSKAVTAGEAKFGEFRDSLNGNVLGGVGREPMEFVPFFSEKAFVVMVEEKGKFVFKTQLPITAENEDHEFEIENEEGKTEKWYRTLNFYVLRPQEIEDGSAIPYLIAFRSSSAKAGQKLMTTMYMKNLKAGKTPASMVMELHGSKTTNDKGTYVVFDVKEKRPATNTEITEAFEWVKTIRAGKVKVDHSDLAEEAGTRNDYAASEPEEGIY